MSTSERPVPAIGQVWKCNASSDDNGCRDEHELASTLEYGRFRDRKGFVCNPSGNMTFVRHAPTPETAPGLPGQPTTNVGSGSAAKPRLCGDCFEEMPCPCDRVKVKPGKLIKSTPLVKPKPQRATYASLMASLRAEEGVPEPARCSGCGRAPCWPPAHVSADAHTAARMREVYEDPRPPEPDHWRPSVDPLFDIPEWNEFGSRKP